MDAVYAAAHAIHKIIEDNCGSNPFELCDVLKPTPLGPFILSYIRNVTFIGKYFFQILNISFHLNGSLFYFIALLRF